MADSNERVTTALDWYVGVQFPGAANAEQACVRGFAFCGVIGGYTACEVFRSTPTAWRKQAVAEPASVTRSPPFEVSRRRTLVFVSARSLCTVVEFGL